ncbi:FAD-dependent oxidoreductase, partial [Chloroflexota bacterium]
DPYFPIKAQEGRPEDIRPCIRCTECADRGVNIGHITCTVNAITGREGELAKITPEIKAKKVAVVGGGPGGMEAARVAALRGHEVTLFEKRELGGLLIEASLPEFKADIRSLIKYQIAQLEKTGVNVVKEEAGFQNLNNGKFDAVVVATGAAVASLPDVPGINKLSVVSALDVLRGAKTGNNVIVVGGGIVGSEVTLLLGKEGKKVTITTRGDKIARGMPMMMRKTYFKFIAELPVEVCTGVHLAEVTDDGIVVSNNFADKSTITGDTVVIAAGFKPNLELWDSLSRIPELEVYAIGDCVEPRTAYDTIHEGFHTAFALI